MPLEAPSLSFLSMKGISFWDERYNSEDYVFGTEPNDFLRQNTAKIPAGPVLCLAEGEGRNSVHLAKQGYSLLAVDQSATGLAKAKRLAARNGVEIKTQVADLSTFEIAPGAWSGIVSIFLHLPASLRKPLHKKVVEGLCSGGVYLLEAYTPRQLAFGTGGPKEVELLLTLEALKEELAGLRFEIGHEIERAVHEGAGHTGMAAVVQVLAYKP